MGLRAAKKTKTPPRGPEEKAKRDKAPALATFWLRSLFGVALVLLLAFAVGLFFWAEKKDADSLRQLESSSDLIARDLGSRVASLQGILRALGADLQLRKAFLEQTPEALRDQEESVARRIPDALQVRLVNPGFDADAGAQTDPLSYAGLDLVHQAERRRGVTLLEVHRLGSPDEHLAIAGPVFGGQGEAVVGIVHVSLPTSLLPAVDGTGGDRGRIALQQRVGDLAVTVGPGRDEAALSEPTDHEAPVPGSRVRVVAWVNRGETLDTQQLLVAGLAYVALMALVALATWLSLRAAQRALSLDYAAIVALVEDALNRNPMRRLQCRLAETRPVVDVLSSLLRNLQPIRAGSPQQQAVPLPFDVSGDVVPVPAPAAATARNASTEGDASGRAALIRPDSVPPEIFRAYDIRGIVDLDLTADLMYLIGLAVGSEATAAGDRTVIVGRDTRRSGEEFSASLVTGLRESGCDVLDLGVVPTPLVYFATRYQGVTSGVVVTASHNPETYNGLKVVIGGSTLTGQQIMGLRERILAGTFSKGDGHYRVGDLIADYVGHVEKDVAIARTLKVVVDCGNAAASPVAPSLFRALGCDLVEVNCNPDAGFPNGRVPDPTRPECMEALQHAVVAQGADLGFAFDGDGDRLGVVDSSGKIIWPDRVLMLLAADVLSRHPGTDVIFDVKSSHHLATEILRHGGRPVMWKTGHAPLKAKLQESGALLAGEWSGHIMFRERWFGFDDALYSGARLLEVLALDPRPSAEVFAELPEAIGTSELFLHLAEGEAAGIMTAVLAQVGELEGLDLYTEDGLRADSGRGWGLVRASNTQPALVFRFEADDEAELVKVQELFRRIMERAAPELQLPF